MEQKNKFLQLFVKCQPSLVIEYFWYFSCPGDNYVQVGPTLTAYYTSICFSHQCSHKCKKIKLCIIQKECTIVTTNCDKAKKETNPKVKHFNFSRRNQIRVHAQKICHNPILVKPLNILAQKEESFS